MGWYKYSHRFLNLPVCVQLVRMDYTEVIIDQRFHRHLIGKNGANSEYTFCSADLDTKTKQRRKLGRQHGWSLEFKCQRDRLFFKI